LNSDVQRVVPVSDEGYGRLTSSTLLDARIVLSSIVLGLLIGVCGVGLDRLVHHASSIHAAEVNHHIRNALTAIVYSTSVRHDQALRKTLKEATDRIDWVLNEILPDGESKLRWPVQAPLWRPRPWSRMERIVR
jgi:hypothetical protein